MQMIVADVFISVTIAIVATKLREKLTDRSSGSYQKHSKVKNGLIPRTGWMMIKIKVTIKLLMSTTIFNCDWKAKRFSKKQAFREEKNITVNVQSIFQQRYTCFQSVKEEWASTDQEKSVLSIRATRNI